MDESHKLVTFEIPDGEGCKTGSRTIPCAEIYGYVQDWMKCNKSDMFMPISENGLKRILIALFDKAGIKKPYNHIILDIRLLRTRLISVCNKMRFVCVSGVQQAVICSIHTYTYLKVCIGCLFESKGMMEKILKSSIHWLVDV